MLKAVTLQLRLNSLWLMLMYLGITILWTNVDYAEPAAEDYHNPYNDRSAWVIPVVVNAQASSFFQDQLRNVEIDENSWSGTLPPVYTPPFLNILYENNNNQIICTVLSKGYMYAAYLWLKESLNVAVQGQDVLRNRKEINGVAKYFNSGPVLFYSISTSEAIIVPFLKYGNLYAPKLAKRYVDWTDIRFIELPNADFLESYFSESSRGTLSYEYVKEPDDKQSGLRWWSLDGKEQCVAFSEAFVDEARRAQRLSLNSSVGPLQWHGVENEYLFRFLCDPDIDCTLIHYPYPDYPSTERIALSELATWLAGEDRVEVLAFGLDDGAVELVFLDSVTPDAGASDAVGPSS